MVERCRLWSRGYEIYSYLGRRSLPSGAYLKAEEGAGDHWSTTRGTSLYILYGFVFCDCTYGYLALGGVVLELT